MWLPRLAVGANPAVSWDLKRNEYPCRKASHSASTAVSGCCQEQGEPPEGFEQSAIGGRCRQPNPGVKMALTSYPCSLPLSHANYSLCIFFFLSIVVKENFSTDVFQHLLLKTYPSLISNLVFLHFRKKRHRWFKQTRLLVRLEGLDFQQSEWSDLTAYERMVFCSSCLKCISSLLASIQHPCLN